MEINIALAAHNLRPHLSVSYGKKFPAQGEIEASDVREPLKDFLPKVAFTDVSRQKALADPKASEFKPPGDKIESFTTSNGSYEVWCSSLADPVARNILSGLQILVPMFIEGGTILELEYPWIVERWKIFLLYNVTDDVPSGSSPYVIAGYATSFQVFTLPERGSELETEVRSHSEAEIDKYVSAWSDDKDSSKSPLTLPSRERISQFILLPSHQGSGTGSRLYLAVYNYLTAPAHIAELTVEDPNESFDDMRDISDLLNLRSTNSTFAELALPSEIPKASLEQSAVVPIDTILPSATRRQLARETKIQPRQLSRLIEMQLLSTIPRLHRSASRITRRERATNPHDRASYFWRLLVKERLYQHNRDALKQLEQAECVEKVESAVESVRADYDRLLETADRRAEMAAKQARKRGRKRSAASAADEEEDEGEQQQQHHQNGSSAGKRKKRVRVVVDEDDEENDSDEPGAEE